MANRKMKMLEEAMHTDIRENVPAKKAVGQDHPSIRISDDELAELIVQSRHYGLFRQDLETGACFFSRAAYRIYDLPFTEQPANIAELLRRTHPDDIEAVSTAFETAARFKTKFHVVHRYRGADGHYKTLRIVAKCRRGEDGREEFIGVVYEFFERLKIAGFAE